jgi:predicted Zn-dependent protease
MEESLAALLEEIVGSQEGDGLALLLEARRQRVVRLAEGRIHQSVDRRTLRLLVTAVEGSRVGRVATGLLSPGEARAAVEEARRLARLAPEDPHFPGLPETATEGATGTENVDEATARASAEELAEVARACIETARAKEATVSGALRVHEHLMLARNSRGLATRGRATRAELAITAYARGNGRRASGYAQRFSPRLAELDPVAVTEDALWRARCSLRQIPLAPGTYPAILEPAAVADLLALFVWMGFGSTEFREARSFLTDRLGQRIVHQDFTLRDDPTDPRTAFPGIDYEGLPRSPITLVRAGVATDLALDLRGAKLLGRPPNGRAGDPLEGWHDTECHHLVLSPGTATREELLSGLRRGLLVTRLWYGRVVQPREARITALTRSGLLWVEDGEVIGGTGNFRIQADLLQLFSNLEAMGDAAVGSHGVITPAVRVASFPLSSPSA